MQIKIKTTQGKHISKSEIDVDIKEFIFSEDLFSTEDGLSIGFAKGPSSGLLVLSQKELDRIAEFARKYTHLVKGVKYFK